MGGEERGYLVIVLLCGNPCAAGKGGDLTPEVGECPSSEKFTTPPPNPPTPTILGDGGSILVVGEDAALFLVTSHPLGEPNARALLSVHYKMIILPVFLEAWTVGEAGTGLFVPDGVVELGVDLGVQGLLVSELLCFGPDVLLSPNDFLF